MHHLLNIRRNISFGLRMHLAASFVLLLGKLLRHRVASLLVTKNQAISTSLIVLTRFLVTKFESILSILRVRWGQNLTFSILIVALGCFVRVEFNLALSIKTSTA